MRLFIFFLTALLLVSWTPDLRAHDHSHVRSPELQDASIEALEEHLSEVFERHLRFGTPIDESAEELRVGKELIEIAHERVLSILIQKGAPSNTRQAAEALRNLAASFNPIKIGSWILETGRRHGPAIAIALACTELTEHMGLLYAASHPNFLFLVPLYFTHAPDIAMFTIVLGMPRMVRTAKWWIRHGGPSGYYRHLVRQREVLPLDWSAIVDTAKLPARENGNVAPEVRYAIITEGKIERRLPRALRVVFGPRKQALKESFPTLAIWELEKLAGLAGFDPKIYRGLKSEPRIYSAALLREIGEAEGAAGEMRRLLLSRSSGGARAWDTARSVDARELSEAKTTDRLMVTGESPDIVAQRLLWYFQHRRDVLHESITELPRQIRGSQRKQFRKLSKLLDEDLGLSRMAASAYESSSARDWDALLEGLEKTRNLIFLIEAERDAFGGSGPDKHEHGGHRHDDHKRDRDHRGLQRCQELLSRG